MALDKKVKKSTVARQRGNLVYYFNPDIVARDGVVFVEDIIGNTMDYQVFYENYFPYKNEDYPPDEETKQLWKNGIVYVGNGTTMLRFFTDNDPMWQGLLAEYDNASDADKPDVYFKLSEVGLDMQGALEDEVSRLKAELEALKRGAATANEEPKRRTAKQIETENN